MDIAEAAANLAGDAGELALEAIEPVNLLFMGIELRTFGEWWNVRVGDQSWGGRIIMVMIQRTDTSSTSTALRRVRVSGRLLVGEVGAGSLLKRLSTRVGIPPCGGCEERAQALDQRLSVVGASGPPAPKPGCWFSGTSCYGFIQTLKFCCDDGTEYTERWGWCIGVWFAPPCYPLRPGGRTSQVVDVAARRGLLGRRARAEVAKRLTA